MIAILTSTYFITNDFVQLCGDLEYFILHTSRSVYKGSSVSTLIWNARYCPSNTTQANPYKSRGSGYPVDPSE